jgi:protocatechuate 3,4-dioxygenase beta subunit
MLNRRHLVLTGLSAAAGVAGLPVWAQARTPTPPQTRGPFYPDRLPADRDSDLVRVTGLDRQAVGTVAHIRGRILGADGRPIPGAIVEIWQCDAQGRYLHRLDSGSRGHDQAFQGYGAARAAADGGYAFRTIKPVAYTGRTPHIHFAVKAPSGRSLVTQMYVEGEPQNATDGVLQSIRSEAARRSVIVRLDPAGDLEAGALKGVFDIVIAG